MDPSPSPERLLAERVERQGEVAVSSGDVLRWSEAHREASPRHWPDRTADWVAPPAMVLIDAVVRQLPGVLGDEQRVLVLGVVLEVGVQTVGPLGVEHEHQPRHLVVDERDQLRQEPVAEATQLPASMVQPTA